MMQMLAAVASAVGGAGEVILTLAVEKPGVVFYAASRADINSVFHSLPPRLDAAIAAPAKL